MYSIHERKEYLVKSQEKLLSKTIHNHAAVDGSYFNSNLFVNLIENWLRVNIFL